MLYFDWQEIASEHYIFYFKQKLFGGLFSWFFMEEVSLEHWLKNAKTWLWKKDESSSFMEVDGEKEKVLNKGKKIGTEGSDDILEGWRMFIQNP